MALILMSLTALGVVVLFAALAVYLIEIASTLEAIGGSPTSYLAKIVFGVRAIEKETAALAPHVTRLTEGLTLAAEGLGAIRDRLGAVVEAVGRQEG